MADNEVRTISIRVQATQAQNALIKTGLAIEQMGGAVGKTDPQLRKLDRQMAKLPEITSRAASTIAKLKSELLTMSKELTAGNTTLKQRERRIMTLNRQLAEQKSIISTQKGLIREFTKDNLRLAQSYDKVAASAGKSNSAVKTGTTKMGGLDSSWVTQAVLRQTAHGYFPNGAVPLKVINQQAQQAEKALVGAAKATNDVTKGARTTRQAVDELGQNVQWNALRYQLYDVAATFGIVGAAGLAASLGVAKAGIEWDKNFANVVRTSQVTGEAVGWLKEQFLDLQTIIPVTSADLATIGTLGAQMGVAAANLTRFTEITAKFSATSGLNVEESATALSRLDELLPDVRGNYERLGSTILRTGVNAVATEAQIVRGTSQIASMGQIAGLTTPEVVALSSAMSSLGFSPELQRSVITSSFSRILTATSAVTEKTQKFGAVLNMTGRQFQQAWNRDAIGTYRDLLAAIAKRGDAVTVLQDLGLASQRLTPNLLKLGQNTGVLNAALADTRDEWGKNTEMTRQYDIIAKTVSARIQVMGQSWEALLVTLDESDVIIGPLIDGLTWLLKTMRNIAKTPGVSTLVSLTTAIGALASITALGAAGLAGMAAGYIAIVNATAGLGAAAAGNTVAMAANTAAVGANNAVRAGGVAATAGHTGALAANTVAAGANGVALSGAGASMLRFTHGVIGALPHILKWAGIIGLAAGAVTGLATLIGTAPDWTYDWRKAFAGIDTPEKALNFDLDTIKEAEKNMAALEKEVKRYDEAVKRGRPQEDDATIDVSASTKLAKARQEVVVAKKDILDEILALESTEDQYRAVNLVSKELGVTQEELLTKTFPALGDALGEGAAEAALLVEELEKLEAAQGRWAIALGVSDVELGRLQEGLQKGAKDFLDFSDSLKDAYDEDFKNGEGLGSFIGSVNKQVAGFEQFYADLGKLVERGGVNLATFFAEQGPDAAQALADSLKLSPEQMTQIENQMSLAQFYQSEDFAKTFSQNNAILAEVWRLSGNNPQAVAAFNAALAESMKGGSVDPNLIAQLSEKFGFEFPINLIPGIDPDTYDDAISLLDAQNALAEARITPITIPITTSVGQGDFTVTREVTNWIVEMEGHSIEMNVDPNTLEGQRIIAEWRANEYKTPVTVRTDADTSGANKSISSFINSFTSKTHYLRFRATVTGNPMGGFSSQYQAPIATGGLIHNNQVIRNNYPGYANGTIVRGPGTGTSDSILARISNGEAVTRARAVRFYGTKMMEDINNMRFPRYATGHTPSGYPGAGVPGNQVNVQVTQMYPTTRDPIKTLKQDAESVLAGIWN